MQNPNCDGEHCMSEYGQVRVLPSGGSGNLILCKSCYRWEMAWRKHRNKELAPSARFDFPEWETLDVMGCTV